MNLIRKTLEDAHKTIEARTPLITFDRLLPSSQIAVIEYVALPSILGDDYLGDDITVEDAAKQIHEAILRLKIYNIIPIDYDPENHILITHKI